MRTSLAFILLAAVSACSTSTTPFDQSDAGVDFDAPGFDAPGLDAPGEDTRPTADSGVLGDVGDDTMLPLVDAGPIDAGATLDGGVSFDAGPARDAGPVGRDTGPRRDAGPTRDTGPPDVGTPTCTPSGVYTTVSAPRNPPICDSVGITSCRVSPGADALHLQLNCGGVSAECRLSAACTCRGSTVFMGVPINVSLNFVMGTASFSAIGNTCDYTLMMR